MRLGKNRKTSQMDKLALQAARLRARAKELSNRADTIERSVDQEFDAFIVSLARGCGLRDLPPSRVALAMRELSERLKNNFSASAGFQRDARLFVRIGKNTSPEKMQLLKMHLRWNGRKGGWTGNVDDTTLGEFRKLFDAEQLIVGGGETKALETNDPQLRPDKADDEMNNDERSADPLREQLSTMTGESENEEGGNEVTKNLARPPLSHFPRR